MNFAKRNYILILIFLIFLSGLSLRLNSISYMSFIGDQGWFYLSARDALVNTNIPLVGITASHTWVHQGPFWTYILSIIFFLTKYNPLAPGYFTAVFDALTIILIYWVSSRLFSTKVAVLSSIIYAFSPILIIFSKMPYHTSPIPLFTLLFFFFICKLAKGNEKYLPFSVLMLSVLYNFELATQVLWAVLMLVLIFNFKTLRKKITKNLIFKTITFFILPLIPVIIYDLNHGYVQTFKFAAWGILSPVKSLIFGSFSQHSYLEFGIFFLNFIKELLLYPTAIVSVVIFIGSAVFLAKKVREEKEKYNSSDFILLISILIPLSALFFNKTASDAYLPIFFPLVVLAVGRMFSAVRPFSASLFVVLMISLVNLYYILSTNYFTLGVGNLFKDRLNISKEIIKKSKGGVYNLTGKGEGSEHRSFTMNYEYLTWYLGNAPSKESKKIKFVIEEKNNTIYLRQK